jgi:hypothetical protein
MRALLLTTTMARCEFVVDCLLQAVARKGLKEVQRLRKLNLRETAATAGDDEV